ncbi:transcriptional regulator, GntR family [Anaerocolumna xylanovorans DSM 12503]|uniref:Transcriptional regulator, GntR family n=2 Tax=Anaerocolumna TaxID=1843210 RepID=A0A1M7XZ05_9FIRM|nr:transcriptional regulator, GntR family [Anaerocolumna xylanovorans DSM 12503]
MQTGNLSRKKKLVVIDNQFFLYYTNCINSNSTLHIQVWITQRKECLMIIIDYKDRRPIYEQVEERFEELILKGGLLPKEQLPSVRNLAMELSINPNTIQRAYMELERKGFIYTVKGRGSFIADTEHLVDIRKNDLLCSVAEILREAKEIGIEKDQVIKKVEEVYEK